VADKANAAGIKVTFEISLGIVHAKAGRPAAAKTHCEALRALIGPDPSPRFAYMQSMVDAHASIASGHLGSALAELARAIEVADQIGNSWYQRSARLLRARVHGDLLDFDAAVADARAAPALSPSLASSVIPMREAVIADAELAAGHAETVRDRLREVLAAKRFVDDDSHESRDLARCVLGDALMSCGDRAAAKTVLSEVKVTPALRARALALRLRDGSDLQAMGEAKRLLESVPLTPLAELRLLTALCAAQPVPTASLHDRASALLEMLSTEPSNRGLLDRWMVSRQPA
jgi:hypothetical protein